eukprot:TRINITY_DN15084_c0_g2_i1.p1 TRINITY_DN15084_c0_g2~~TRINITY_DN15084_c0_g2_i1.p1  ORF type:complete len:286 (+),score=49.28 TRINITY_DN15084_c0_g2_i1:75-932(+)
MDFSGTFGRLDRFEGASFPAPESDAAAAAKFTVSNASVTQRTKTSFAVKAIMALTGDELLIPGLTRNMTVLELQSVVGELAGIPKQEVQLLLGDKLCGKPMHTLQELGICESSELMILRQKSERWTCYILKSYAAEKILLVHKQGACCLLVRFGSEEQDCGPPRPAEYYVHFGSHSLDAGVHTCNWHQHWSWKTVHGFWGQRGAWSQYTSGSVSRIDPGKDNGERWIELDMLRFQFEVSNLGMPRLSADRVLESTQKFLTDQLATFDLEKTVSSRMLGRLWICGA